MSRPPGDAPPLDLRLVPAAVTAWLVAWQVRVVPPRWVVLAAVPVALAGVLLLLRGRRRWAAGLAAALLCAAAAGAAASARTAVRTAAPLPQLAERQAAVTLIAVLTDDPRRVARPTGARALVVAEVRVEQLHAGRRTVRLRAPVLVLTSDQRWLPLLPGQRVRVEGRLGPARRGDDVAALLSARTAPELLGRPSPAQRVAGHLRDGLRAAVAHLPAAERGLLPGLVVGDTSRLDPDLREDFRTTGLTHLTAVSGTNCAIVAGAALLLARRLGLGLRAGPGLAGLALLGFVVLARPSPSVLRAAVMGGVGLLALAAGGRRSAVPALATAVLALVLLDPDLAGTPGFALSVLATAGLLLLAPPWRERLGRHLPPWLAAALVVPAAAQVACGPVVVALSGQLGLLSVPANLLAVPAVAPATVLGVVLALLAPVWLPLAQLLAWVAWLPTAWLVLVARTGADVPWASLPWLSGHAGALLLAGVTAALWLLLALGLTRRLLAAATAGVLLSSVVLGAARPAWPPPGWFLVSCDVGQGDAHVLALGGGSAVLVDAGPDPRVVDRCLDRLDVQRLALVVLTHLHADHVGGLPGVLGRRPVGAVQIGPSDEPAEQWGRLTALAQRAGVPLVAARLGEVRAEGRVRWEVLAPRRAYRGTSSDPNNASLVLRVQAGPVSVLLTGDIEPEAQRDLLARGPDLRADVLKVPHHGSDHQEPAFLDAVAARVVLTSVGADNTYGHPSSDTLDLLAVRGVRAYRTDRDGDVALVLRDGALLTAGREGSGELRGPTASAPGAGRRDTAAPLPRAGGPLPPSGGVLGVRLPPRPLTAPSRERTRASSTPRTRTPWRARGPPKPVMGPWSRAW